MILINIIRDTFALKKLRCIHFRKLIKTATLLLFLTPIMSIYSVSIYAKPPVRSYLQHRTQVMQSVVNISVQKKMDPQLFALLKKQTNLPSKMPLPKLGYMGSGVIVNAKKGYIITNLHVVKNADNIIVTLNSGDHYQATLKNSDADNDLAVLQIKAQEPLIAMPFANSDQLEVGQAVFAIGHPFGLRESVTGGIVSALDRSIQITSTRTQSFLQTDAPINPGNSGGALVNQAGQLVGINTAIISNSNEYAGIGFSIPSNTVQAIYQQLITHHKIKHGMLGVVAQNITPILASTMGLVQHDGVIVTQVMPESAAAKAGLKVQDILSAVDRLPLHSAQQLHNILALKRPSTPIKIDIIRHHKKQQLTAQLMRPQDMMTTIASPPLTGMELRDYREIQTSGQQIQGVEIKSLTPTSKGALANLQPGDVIIAVNGQEVDHLPQLIELTRLHAKNLWLTVSHQGKQLFAVLH